MYVYIYIYIYTYIHMYIQYIYIYIYTHIQHTPEAPGVMTWRQPLDVRGKIWVDYEYEELPKGNSN